MRAFKSWQAQRNQGSVAERFKALVLKTSEDESPP